MLRAAVCSLVVAAICLIGPARADDASRNSDKDKKQKATITRLDPKKSTLTVKMKDADGKEQEKTFQLADGVKYVEKNGKAAKSDDFHAGDHVLIVEKDGKITELKRGKNHLHATITKVDANKGTIAVTMKGEDGKKVDRTLQVADGVKYFDDRGKAAKIDDFQSGDHVSITEKDGKVSELKKRSEATITKVDAKKGTLTVKMKDEKGKEVERTFYLTEDVEYVDSTGEVAAIDVFRSGDDVLIVEAEGKIKEVTKKTEETKSADKRSGGK